jgi:hypothetical protein
MPKGLTAINFLVCERVLIEQDQVLTIIRVVDVFFIKPIPNVPPENRLVTMTVLAMAKFAPEDASDHTMQFSLIRPDGDKKTVGDLTQIKLAPKKYPGLHSSVNFFTPVNVIPSQLGTHYFVISVDGEEVARTPFTLQEQKQTPEVLQ